jgi:uncharacterized protein YfaP (DUF2135 family)
MRRILICSTVLACMAPLLLQAQVTLQTPAGGWRASTEARRDFMQEVHYPASSVNANGIKASALIQGRITQSPKPLAAGASAALRAPTPAPTPAPARLVVDGVALPLLVNEDGSYARPWSFGSGSHGVEVRTADGTAAKRVQFVEAASRTAVKLRLVLSWDSDSTDLDLHVISPDGQHVFYGSRLAANGGALDVDVTTGYGPEIFASPTPPAGIWHVYVNYYGAGETRGVITVAQLAIITDEGTPRERQQVLRVPMRKAGELTRVRSFVMP